MYDMYTMFSRVLKGSNFLKQKGTNANYISKLELLQRMYFESTIKQNKTKRRLGFP